MYLGGLLWFLALPSDHIHSASYFSENSLLPGLVKGGFVEDSFAKTLLVSLQDEISANPTKMPYPWLLAQFRQIGLDAYTHNFTLNYPLANDMTFEGQNVYGILRAPRGSSTEAIVLSVPFRGSKSVHPSTAAGVALILAIAKFCRRQKYWAKDLIFLITEHEQLGAQAWLEAYHRTSSGRYGVLNSGDLTSRGGAIQAAVNLELFSDRISHVDVKIEGLNGQLPNLDLVNLVHMLCNKEGVHHTFHNRANLGDREYNRGDPIKMWTYSLRTMAEMVCAQASGVPNGNHGLFHRFGIEAVTLTGYRKVDRGSPATFYQVGRVLEGILRSLNNLLERFHQSYFFYLLSATDRYISIGVYIPAVGLMASTLLLRALAVWRSLQIPTFQTDKEKLMRAQEMSNCFASVGITVLVAHALGVVLLRVPVWSALYLNAADTSLSVVIGLMSFTAISTFLPIFKSMHSDTLLLLYVIGLIELATILLAVSLHNFPLAVVCSIVLVPFALLVGGRRLRFLRIIGWFLVQPLLLVAGIILVYTSVHFPDDAILPKAMHAFKEALTFSYVDYAVYGNWMLSVGATFLFPMWFVLWIVVLKGNISTSKDSCEAKKGQ